MTNKITKLMLNWEGYEIREYQEWWWQPWANTIAYWKLDGDMLDYSWNWYDGTWWTENYTTLSSWIQVANFNWTSSIETTYTQTISTEPFTILWWFKRANTWEQYWLWKWAVESNYSYLHMGFYSNWTVVMDFYGTTNPSWQCSDTDWHFAAFTYSWTTQRCYYDDNTPQDITKSFNEFAWALWLGSRVGWRNKFSWNLSNVIIENKARTDQEIVDYYNQTKSLYGIS